MSAAQVSSRSFPDDPGIQGKFLLIQGCRTLPVPSEGDIRKVRHPGKAAQWKVLAVDFDSDDSEEQNYTIVFLLLVVHGLSIGQLHRGRRQSGLLPFVILSDVLTTGWICTESKQHYHL